MIDDSITRRSVIAAAGLGVSGAALARAGGGAPPPVDTGTVAGGKVALVSAPAEAVAGAVAEVSVDAPVAAEPAHQSLLARTFGEALV